MAGRVITVAQQKGGAGKTTLVVSLGLAWTALGRKVAFVDIDPQGSLGRWGELRRRQEGLPPVTLVALTGWRAQSEIERLKQTHNLVVVDSAPHAQTDAKTAIRAADLVLVPFQPSPLDLWATQPTVVLAREERVPALLVANRVPSRSALTEEIVAGAAELGAPLAKARLGNRNAFPQAMASGRGVGEASSGSLAARETAALAREVLDRLEGGEKRSAAG